MSKLVQYFMDLQPFLEFEQMIKVNQSTPKDFGISKYNKKHKKGKK